jgi:hypothetical protein
VTNLFQTYFPGEWRVPDNQGNPWLVLRSGSHGSLRGGSGTVRPVFDSTRSRNQLIHPLHSTSSPCRPRGPPRNLPMAPARHQHQLLRVAHYQDSLKRLGRDRLVNAFIFT